MSWRACAWAKRQRTGLPGAKSTLMMLAEYTNAEGMAWPSQQMLADDTEQSLDSIQRHLQLLEELGLITIERRPGHGRVYRLPFNRPHLAATTSRTMRPSKLSHQPHHAASGSRTVELSTPQTTPKKTDNFVENQMLKASEPISKPIDERLEPHSEPPVKNSLLDEPPKTEDRKNRPTLEEIYQRYGRNFGLKSM